MTRQGLRSTLVLFVSISTLLAFAHPARATRQGEERSASWALFRSDTGGFQVQMPGEPVRNEQSVYTDYGTMTQQQFISESPEAVCIVAYLDFPKDAVASKGADLILDDGCRGALQGMGVDETAPRRVIDLKGNAGRAIEAAAKDGSVKVWGRFFLVGNRNYILLYAAVSGGSAASAARFFDSFALL